MFRSFNSIQSPINATRRGDRDYIEPKIYFYSSLFDSNNWCTSRGTGTCSNSSNLINPYKYLNSLVRLVPPPFDNQGFFTGFREGSSDPFASASQDRTPYFQIGIDWVGTNIYPEYRFDNKFIVTIERLSVNQSSNRDIAVTQEVIKETATQVGVSSDLAGDYDPYDLRDGNTSWGNDDSQGILHAFTDPILLNSGYLYYAVITYPENWDPYTSYYGVDGLIGFTKMSRSFIWLIDDVMLEDDSESFAVRIRALPNNFIELEDNLLRTDPLSYQNDFITRENETKVINHGEIVAEVKFKIENQDYGASQYYPYYDPITSHPNLVNALFTGEISQPLQGGVIGLPPVIRDTTGDFLTGSYNSLLDDFEGVKGVIGNSGWNYPGVTYSPYLSNNSPNQFEWVHPIYGGGNYADQYNDIGRTPYLSDYQASFLEGKLPSGPFHFLYNSSTFVSFYTRSELESIGMTTDSRIQWFAMDQLCDTQYGGYGTGQTTYPDHVSIHIAHLEDTGTSPIISGTSASSDPKFKTIAKYPGTNVGYSTNAQGATLTDMNYLDLTRIYMRNVSIYDWKYRGQKIFTTDSDFYWDGESNIAIIWSYQKGKHDTSGTLDDDPFAEFNTSRYAWGPYEQDAPMFKMGKTYYTDTDDAGGSFMYAYPVASTFGWMSFNFRGAHAKPEVDGGIYKYQFNNTKTVGIVSGNYGTTWTDKSWKEHAGGNMITIPARPILGIGYDNPNPSDLGPAFQIDIRTLSATSATSGGTIKLYLLDNNYDNQYFEKRVIPIPFDRKYSSGIYGGTTTISNQTSWNFSPNELERLVADAGISTFRGTYQIIMEVTNAASSFQTDDDMWITLPRGAGPLNCLMDHTYNNVTYPGIVEYASQQCPNYRDSSEIYLFPTRGFNSSLDIQNPVTLDGNMMRNNWLQVETNTPISQMSNYPNSSMVWNYISETNSTLPFYAYDTSQYYTRTGIVIKFDHTRAVSNKSYLLMNATPFKF